MTVRIAGKDLAGFATVTRDDLPAKTEGLNQHLRGVRSNAQFFGVTTGPDGAYNWSQIEKAAEKNMMIRVRLTEKANPVSAGDRQPQQPAVLKNEEKQSNEYLDRLRLGFWEY